jgi:hypothetical protein
MVVCSGGLVNFINGSATPSPFCNEASSSPHKLKQTSTQRHLSSSKAMHFLLLSASGRTGQHVVSELLSQGHTAVALVRTSGSLTPRPGLTIVTGSPLSKSDIRSALLAITFCSDHHIEHSPQVRQPFRGSDLTSSLPGRLVRQCLRGSGACRLLSRCSDVDSRCRGFMG